MKRSNCFKNVKNVKTVLCVKIVQNVEIVKNGGFEVLLLLIYCGGGGGVLIIYCDDGGGVLLLLIYRGGGGGVLLLLIYRSCKLEVIYDSKGGREEEGLHARGPAASLYSWYYRALHWGHTAGKTLIWLSR